MLFYLVFRKYSPDFRLRRRVLLASYNCASDYNAADNSSRNAVSLWADIMCRLRINKTFLMKTHT